MSQLTIEDIARLAGVSRSTVSRVINGQPSVRPAVRHRVQEVINAHKYTPQAAARQLVTQRTRTIGLILPDLAYNLFANPIFALMGQGVSQVCVRREYVSMQLMGQRDREEQTLFGLLRSRHFDGVVLISGEYDDPCPAFLKNSGIPYVRIGRDPNHDDLKYVDIDNVEAARSAVKHLIGLGHRRIAMIKGLMRDTSAVDRYEGYKQALLEVGIPLDEELVGDGDWTVACGYNLTQRFLDLPSPPTALFSSNDIMVAGVVRAAHERGIRVPEDLAIVGFDDLDQTTMIFPELTTIRQPCVQMGVRAAEILIDQLENDNTEPVHELLPTTLVIRQSCGYYKQQSAAP
ncbi:MAG TPA: LacI family DNA-binding transcriptional regulator [Ktedonobacteraceae bacterium]|jgi:DNA-binding LacI/PurR family transcriptional regulator|nr:LacI family DNA-binding transcriptional regulator [Ktedonobacteraceae bacterium]